MTEDKQTVKSKVIEAIKAPEKIQKEVVKVA